MLCHMIPVLLYHTSIERINGFYVFLKYFQPEYVLFCCLNELFPYLPLQFDKYPVWVYNIDTRMGYSVFFWIPRAYQAVRSGKLWVLP